MRRRMFVGLAILALTGLQGLAGSAVGGQARTRPASFTLEQVLSSPFPTELTAAPVGEAFAWVFNDRGRRAIWVAEGPTFVGHAIVSFDADDGQDIGELRWTSDARSLLYVRGGAANRRGEIPNPTSQPGGAEQTIWMVARSGGPPRKLGAGHDLAISSRGGRVVWVAQGQLWAASLEGEARAAPLTRLRGDLATPRFSPDGSRVAFVSRRGTHALVGVIDLDDPAVRWLDPSVDADDEPVWSPEGTRVAFLRRPVNTGRLPFIPEREGEPWSIRVADARSGLGREVWRASPGRGSVYREVVGTQQLWWADGDHLVFPWEREGWTQLFAAPAAGGPPRLLTPGRFEVEYVSLTADRRAVVYNSNQDDVDRRHLWKVEVSGSGPPVALTSGSGIEWAPAVLPDGQTVAYLGSDARRPAQPWVLVSGRSARELAPGSIPADFPTEALAFPEAVTFSAADGMSIPAQLFKPADIAPGERRPAVIFLHGGSRRQMLLGWNYRDYYHNAYAFNQYLVSRGFIVLSVNYRSGIGYGLEFREAPDYGASGASEFNDVVGAGLYLRNRPDVDGARIGLWGGSYGGYLTALGLARASHLFAVGVDLHGVHDWNVVIRNFVPGYDRLARPDVARRAFESSPMNFIDSWRSPVLLIHGDDDRNVPFSETVDLIEQLRRHGVAFEQLVFPDEVHGFLRHDRWVQAYTAAAQYLERHLVTPRAPGGER